MRTEGTGDIVDTGHTGEVPENGRRTLPRPLHPFRHRDYRLLVASIAASLFASGLWLVALVWQVIALGGGPSQLSVVSAAASLGLLLSVLVGGLAADRLPRRLVLVGVEVVRIGSASTTAVLALTGGLALWHLAVLAFVIGAAEAFFYPAYSAILPTLLPADELFAANGVEGILRPVLMQAAGPALAGLIVGLFLPGAALLTAAVCFGLALLPLLAMRATGGGEAAEPGTATSVLADLGEGFRFLLRTGWLFATLAFATLYVLVVMGPIEVLLPFAVRDRTGSGPGGYALVLATYGIGGALGSIAMAAGRMPRRYLSVMIMLWGAGATPLVVVGLTDRLWLMAVAGFVVEATGSAGMVIWGTLLQRRVPAHLLGRVSSLDFFVSLALLPVSTALAGPVGEALGLPITFVLAGAVPVLLGLAAIVGWRLDRDEVAHPIADGSGGAPPPHPPRPAAAEPGVRAP